MADLRKAAEDLAAAHNLTPEQAVQVMQRALAGVGDGPGDWPQWERKLWEDVAAFHEAQRSA